MKNENPRVLIFRGGAIGDFVLTVPVFSAIRARWPESHIEFAGYPRVGELALACGLADCFQSLDKAEIARMFVRGASLSPGWAENLRSFDIIISYLHDPDNTVRDNFSRATAGSASLVIHHPPLPPSIRLRSTSFRLCQATADKTAGQAIQHPLHAVDHLLMPLAGAGIPVTKGLIPSLCPGGKYPDRGKERLKKLGTDVVAIHPGSGSEKKNWPIGKFVALACRLRKDNELSPVFILGEADGAIVEALARMSAGIPVVSDCDLVELAALLGGCRGYAGNDSGITHLAAAVGIPVVALYGPTDPGVWGPRGGNVGIIRAREPTADGLAAIEPEAVFTELSRLISRAGRGSRRRMNA